MLSKNIASVVVLESKSEFVLNYPPNLNNPGIFLLNKIKKLIKIEKILILLIIKNKFKKIPLFHHLIKIHSLRNYSKLLPKNIFIF